MLASRRSRTKFRHAAFRRRSFDGERQMRQKLLTTLPLVVALTFAAASPCNDDPLDAWRGRQRQRLRDADLRSGPGFRRPANAAAITNITGFFSDNALGFTSAIKSLAAISPSIGFQGPARPRQASAGIQACLRVIPGRSDAVCLVRRSLLCGWRRPIACLPRCVSGRPDGVPVRRRFLRYLRRGVHPAKRRLRRSLEQDGNFDHALIDPSATPSTNNIGI